MKSLDGLHPVFRKRVEALLADPEAVAAGITIVSAFRSNEYQAQLFAAAVKKYGSEAAARKWVAPPGRSNHGPRVPVADPKWGIAVDFGIRGVKAVSGQWPPAEEALMRRLGARYHLHSPMAWEDWHYEPIEGRSIRLDGWVPDIAHEEDDLMAKPVEYQLVTKKGGDGAVHVSDGVRLVKGVPNPAIRDLLIVAGYGPVREVPPDIFDWLAAPK